MKTTSEDNEEHCCWKTMRQNIQALFRIWIKYVLHIRIGQNKKNSDNLINTLNRNHN